MKKLPFPHNSQIMVIDYLCGCGGRWSNHHHNLETGELHGGILPSTGCTGFTFVGYAYEQAKYCSIITAGETALI